MTENVDSGKSEARLDEDLAEQEGAEIDVRAWDSPGRDGVVGEDETDPDRRDLRAIIGQHISLAPFPSTTEDLIATAMANDAPPQVLDRLRTLIAGDTFANTQELWSALDLHIDQRF